MLPNAPTINHSGSQSPNALARAAGWIYLLNFAFGPGMYALKTLVRVDDAGATATNILAHATLYRLGFTGNLIAVAAYLVVTALFYQLFKPVSKTISLTAAIVSAAGCGILAVGCVFYLAPFVVLPVLHAAAGAATPQAQMLALTFIKLYGQSYNTSLVFFGFYLVLIGYLIIKSTFLPRGLGIAVMLAGPWGLTFLWPPLARALYPYMLLSGIGELALLLWLIIKGVNVDRWHEQARVT